MSGYVGKEKSVGKRYKQHFVFTRLYISRPCSVRPSTNTNSTLLFYQTCETCGLAPCVHLWHRHCRVKLRTRGCRLKKERDKQNAWPGALQGCIMTAFLGSRNYEDVIKYKQLQILKKINCNWILYVFGKNRSFLFTYTHTYTRKCVQIKVKIKSKKEMWASALCTFLQ